MKLSLNSGLRYLSLYQVQIWRAVICYTNFMFNDTVCCNTLEQVLVLSSSCIMLLRDGCTFLAVTLHICKWSALPFIPFTLCINLCFLALKRQLNLIPFKYSILVPQAWQCPFQLSVLLGYIFILYFFNFQPPYWQIVLHWWRVCWIVAIVKFMSLDLNTVWDVTHERGF